MMRMVPIAFALLLCSPACSAEVAIPEDGADQQAKQCLMQQKRQVSRSETVHRDVKSHTDDHAAPTYDENVARTVSTAVKVDKAVGQKAAAGKVAEAASSAGKDDKDVEDGEDSSAAKIGTSAGKEAEAIGKKGEDAKVVEKGSTSTEESKAASEKSEDVKSTQTVSTASEGDKAGAQKGDDAESAEPADKESSDNKDEENSNEDLQPQQNAGEQSDKVDNEAEEKVKEVKEAPKTNSAVGASSNNVDVPQKTSSAAAEASDVKGKSQDADVKMLEDSNGRDLLPRHLMALAWKVFKEEDAIRKVVENAVVVPVTHAGISMSLRINEGDDATQRLGAEGTWNSYDLDTLGDNTSKDILNMIDIGGNYGVVTIAAMKKFAKQLRVVTVEPIPVTFFFLKWNLYINGVPEIDQSKWDSDKGTAGVLALNSGSSDVAGQSLHFCAWLDSSMNSKMCDCKEGEPNCEIIPSITIDNLVGMFGKQTISMVKMDCEGCETRSLPALGQPDILKRVRRLAGELHMPEIPEDSRKNIEDIACKWDSGRLMSKCQWSPADTRDPPQDVECDVKLSCA